MTRLPHCTVATVVERQGRFLLVEEIENGKSVLNQPAGHLEQQESLLAAAVRETREETGWTVRLDALIGIYQYHSKVSGISYVRICLSATPLAFDASIELDQGILGTHWLDIDQLEKRRSQWRSPLVARCIRDYLLGVSFPLSLVTEFVNDPELPLA